MPDQIVSHSCPYCYQAVKAYQAHEHVVINGVMYCVHSACKRTAT